MTRNLLKNQFFPEEQKIFTKTEKSWLQNDLNKLRFRRDVLLADFIF